MVSPGESGGSSLVREEPPLASASRFQIAGWELHHYSAVTSTNLLAASLSPWHAVRSELQTAGRGRFQRPWVSDRGGLWLSAVVPLSPEKRILLPLAMGVATVRMLEELGVPDLRLRWPNDVLIGNRKIAGLLIDQFKPHCAVVGIGLNVHNQPEAHDPTLLNRVIRLQDVLPAPPPLDDLTARLLASIRRLIGELEQGAFASQLAELNSLWRGTRQVKLQLDREVRTGIFSGVDARGRLRLTCPNGAESLFEAHEVRQLTEIETDP